MAVGGVAAGARRGAGPAQSREMSGGFDAAESAPTGARLPKRLGGFGIVICAADLGGAHTRPGRAGLRAGSSGPRLEWPAGVLAAVGGEGLGAGPDSRGATLGR